jgi:hypothetical protein
VQSAVLGEQKMEVEESIDEKFVLEECANFFPHIREDNFAELFKINIYLFVFICNSIISHKMNNFKFKKQTTNLTKSMIPKMTVRNLMITLFFLKHYMPVRASCILFGVEKSAFLEIFQEFIDTIYFLFKHLINIDNRKYGNDKCSEIFADTFIIVDSTECLVQSNLKSEFSGKKNFFTWKYQLLVGAVTAEILGVHGPENGPVSDATIYETSGLRLFLESEDEYTLADKGYVGCSHAIHPKKKKRSSVSGKVNPFTSMEIEKNKTISHFRINVERVNSYIKDWNILSHVYRGLKEYHGKIFIVCCLLYNLSNQFEL